MTAHRGIRTLLATLIALGCALREVPAEESPSGAIRLAAPAEEGEQTDAEAAPLFSFGGRRGFDYDAFDSRLEGLWFQRKVFLAAGRESDAARQKDLIRTFVREEGVRRLEPLAGALVAEARRDLDEGSYGKALDALDLADSLDPGRSQIHFLRAAVLWKSGEGFLPAVTELSRGLKSLLAGGWTSFALVNQFALVLALALLAGLGVFALAMVARHQVALRHEVEESLARTPYAGWAEAAGWAVLWLPALVWFGTGWLAHYWILVTFRFMRRAEKAAAVAFLLLAAAAVPCYRTAVALYGMTSDPVVRTTLAAAEGNYDPDRIVRLRQIVDSHPDEPVYRFLLAGLYKNGRYFEEAFEQYKKVLALAPTTWQAYVNLGNIYSQMGQYGEAIAHYRQAVEKEPGSVLPWFDMYVAQSESFRLREAEESLGQARRIDPAAVGRLLSHEGREGERLEVVDAAVDSATVWKATLEGKRLKHWLDSTSAQGFLRPLAAQWVNPLSAASLLMVFGCLGLAVGTRGRRPARPCLRCGRPFCSRCKSRREGQDYCSQCVHLFVLGDGLAPETKTRKLYEIERYGRVRRRLRRLASLVVPGAGHLLAGRTWRGGALALLWLTALLAWHPVGLTAIDRWMGLDLRLDLLQPPPVPVMYSPNPWTLIGLPLAMVVWLVGNLGAWRSREA